MGLKKACPTLALIVLCEVALVALGAPLMPPASASLLSLCLDGLQCVKHRAELPKACISAAIKLWSMIDMKMLHQVWKNELVPVPFSLRSSFASLSLAGLCMIAAALLVLLSFAARRESEH